MTFSITSTNNITGYYVVEEFSAKEMRRIYEGNCKLPEDVDRQRTYLIEVIKSAARQGKYYVEYNSKLHDENLKFFISKGFFIERELYTVISW
jgi:hypothetical protein